MRTQLETGLGAQRKRSSSENWRRSSMVEQRRRGCGEREQRRVREAGAAGLGKGLGRKEKRKTQQREEGRRREGGEVGVGEFGGLCKS